MDPDVLEKEKSHLQKTIVKLTNARKNLEKSMEVMGAQTLEKLKELREDPQTEPHDLLLFMENLQQKNTTFNFKDKYKRLDELQQSLDEPYFSRIDLKDANNPHDETWYIGKFGYTEDVPVIVDWRAKIASIYYRYRYPQKNVVYETPDGTEKRDLTLKRTFEIDKGELIKYYNNDIQLDENEIIVEKIEQRTGGVLEDIVETIQESQLDIIEADPRQICIVQGSVGSGKSTVAIHKLSHIFFNFPELIFPERSILIAKNQILVGYLSTLFPKLGIFDINYKTLRDLVYNVVFREELKLNIDFDRINDIMSVTVEEISTIREKIKNIQIKYENEIQVLFQDPDNETFGGFKYNRDIPVYENFTEVLSDMEEELQMQRDYLKEYGEKSARAWRFKENIKILRRIVNKLKRLRTKLRESDFTELHKSLSLPVNGQMGYKDTLMYLFIYSEVIGFQNIQKYQYCVVDEGQDFSLLEYLILGKLVINGRFCILGDLNQSISDEGIPDWDSISRVIKEARSANTFELDTNYRSTRPIIDFANSILMPYTNDYLPKSINRRGVDPVVKVFSEKDHFVKEFSGELANDVKELNKSIGIICFDENLLEQIDTLITIMGVNGERYIKLDSKKKISYIPKGIYLTNHENCKGLEFSKVYVLGLDPSKISQFNEAKKAFVAVTRAMNELHIYHY